MSDMEVVFPRCCGIDVHKKDVKACVRILEGGKLRKEVRTFPTMTRSLLELSDWLRDHHVTHVAMESTGVYWKPVYNLLEAMFELLLVNAHHIKQVPGRKTDVRDCEWIAQLLQHGLLRGSFVPDRQIRELRDLTRHRVKLAQDKASCANRIQKILEDANIKLASVASDVLGKSGRRMLAALVSGEDDPEALAELALGRLRQKIPELREALFGRLTEHHRFMLYRLIQHLEFLETEIDAFSVRIEELMRPFDREIELSTTIGGVGRRTAEAILAEIGSDMNQFPSGKHLASWAGICPGNNESAGKRKTGRTPRGNRWLKRALAEAAWSASRTKGTYLSQQFRRIAARRGSKRALVAVAHSILISLHYMLRQGLPYDDPGPGHFDTLDPERIRRYHVKRLKQLGFEVELQPKESAA